MDAVALSIVDRGGPAFRVQIDVPVIVTGSQRPNPWLVLRELLAQSQGGAFRQDFCCVTDEVLGGHVALHYDLVFALVLAVVGRARVFKRFERARRSATFGGVTA